MKITQTQTNYSATPKHSKINKTFSQTHIITTMLSDDIANLQED